MAVWEPLIVCSSPEFNHPCGFADLITLTEHVINDLVFISTLIAVVVFIWIGFQLITSGGNPGAKAKALHALRSLMIGYLCILGAWVLVYTITSVLLQPGYSILIGAPK